MKKTLILLISIIFLNSCNSQTKRNSPNISGNIKTDLNNLLQNGHFSADIMDGVKQSPRQQELTLKFQQGVQNNYEWFVEQLKTVESGKPMPYHPNLGLTEDEYIELQSFNNDIEIISTGKENVEVIKNDSIISFKSQGKLKILESVKVHLNKDEIIIGQYTLTYLGAANITDTNNGLKSKWKGHNWRYEFPENLDLGILKDLENLKAKQYKFTIGKLEKNGKTFLQIKGREFYKGVKEVEFDIPIIF